LKCTQNLKLNNTLITCLVFENLVMQSYPQMQSSLMDQLHEHEFISLVIDVFLDFVRARLHSCAGPTTGAWLLACLSTPSLCLSSTHFLTTLCICLNISHLIAPHLSQCQCCHTINDLGIHLLCCSCENDCTTTHDTLQNTIATIASKSGAHI
jgi:hypothetical protein